MLVSLFAACTSTDRGATDSAFGDTSSPVTSAYEWPRSELQLRLPVLDPAVIVPGAANPGVDHDDGAAGCLDYAGYGDPWCFDNHKGTDFTLLGGLTAMDAGLGEIVAAADGSVLAVNDGNYDRCHPGPKGVDCDGNPVESNYVVLVHATGERTAYWHLKSGILVEPGQAVLRGDPLGYMGASASPEVNVHFELQDVKSVAFDPYAGELSQALTYWCGQGEHGELPSTDCPPQ